jgi:glycosyltransferase involved in cell wall biosynthesis
LRRDGRLTRVLAHVRQVGLGLARRVSVQAGAGYRPYSRLFVVGDNAGWALDEERGALEEVARRLGVRVANPRWATWIANQAVFYCSQYLLGSSDWISTTHRVGLSYFHGRPGTGVVEFDRAFEGLRQHHERLTRVRVSHREMRDVVVGSGIDPRKVHLIPIGINLAHFTMQTAASRRAARQWLGIPDGRIVIGSFQKDGVGWGDGLEPKLIKGPEALLHTIELLRSRVPDLFVLLSGPARGFVKAGLDRLKVPYRHVFVSDYREVGRLFQALDVYLVTSRQEGGPKAVLESMASGVPLVTTRVGQAMDLVRHGENGWMVEIDDVEGLARWTEHAIDRRADLEAVLRAGRSTAGGDSTEAQTERWARLLRGLVEW